MENGLVNSDKKSDPERENPAQEEEALSKPETRDKGSEVSDLDGQIDVLAKEVESMGKCIENNETVGIVSPELADKRQALIGRIESLEDKKSAWLDMNGEKDLPEDVSVENGPDDWATKLNLEHGQAERMTKEQRRKLIDDWEKRAALKFSKHLESNWRCRDAINLPMAVEVIKNNVPLTIEKKSKKFLAGESDFLPDLIIMNFKVNSLLDSLQGKPNMIRELKLDFGGESEVLADEQLLTESDTDEDEKSEEKNDLAQAA